MQADLVDPRRLMELRTDYGAVAAQLLDVFEDSAGATVDEIRTAVEGEDLDGVRRLAHRLKGGSRNVGATRIARLSELIESRPDAAGRHVAALAGAIEPTCAALRAALRA